MKRPPALSIAPGTVAALVRLDCLEATAEVRYEHRVSGVVLGVEQGWAYELTELGRERATEQN